MTFSTAIYAFGYDLGSGFGYAPTDPRPRPAWFTTDPLSDDSVGIGRNAYSTLLVAAGFTERWTEAHRETWQRQYDEAARSLDLEIIETRLWDVPRWFLTSAYVATHGDPGEVVRPGGRLQVTEADSERLRWALGVLGFDPPEPEWLLISVHDEWHNVSHTDAANRTPPGFDPLVRLGPVAVAFPVQALPAPVDTAAEQPSPYPPEPHTRGEDREGPLR
jgi:hypothetical protein